MGLFDFFSAEPAQEAAQRQQAALRQGLTDLSALYGTGRDVLASNYAQAAVPFTQNYNIAYPGMQAFANAVGVGGQQGYDQAAANFRASPGYQWQLAQGTENVLRNRARTGQLASGGTNIDLQTYAQGLADQEYQRYIQNLQPFLGQSNVAASGLGNIYTGLGTGLAGTYTQQGQAAYGTDVGIGNAQAQAALAPYQASANFWNLLQNVGKTAAQAYGARGTG